MLYLIINGLLMIIKPGSPRSHLNDCQECSEGPRSPHNSNAKVGSSAFARSAALRSHMWRIRPTTGTSNSGGRRQHEKHVCKVADANFTMIIFHHGVVGNHRGRHGPHGRFLAPPGTLGVGFFLRCRVTGHHGAAELLPADAPAARSSWVRKFTYYMIHT